MSLFRLVRRGREEGLFVRRSHNINFIIIHVSIRFFFIHLLFIYLFFYSKPFNPFPELFAAVDHCARAVSYARPNTHTRRALIKLSSRAHRLRQPTTDTRKTRGIYNNILHYCTIYIHVMHDFVLCTHCTRRPTLGYYPWSRSQTAFNRLFPRPRYRISRTNSRRLPKIFHFQ